jgi:hypothetical protein
MRGLGLTEEYSKSTDNALPPVLQAIARASRSAVFSAALFSMFLNLLMLVPSLYMLQVYDRVLSTGSVPTLVVLTVITVFLFMVFGGLGANAAVIGTPDPWPDVERSGRIRALPFVSGTDYRTSPDGTDPIGCPLGSQITREVWAAGNWEMYCIKTWPYTRYPEDPADVVTPTPSPTPSPTASPSASATSSAGASGSGGANVGETTRPAVSIPARPTVTDQGDQEGMSEDTDAEITVASIGSRWLVTLITNSPDTDFSVTARKPGAKTISWKINSGASCATSFRTSRSLGGYVVRVRFQGETLDLARV